MQHAILHGEFEIVIDEKGRMLIPSDIRKSINPERDGEAFFLTIGVNRKPWLYPDKYYERIVSAAENDITPNEDALAFDQIYFAMSSRVDMDKQGRMVLPDKALKRTGTGREVTLIGARDHLEIWNRAEWDAQFESHLARLSELAKRAKQARNGGPSSGPQQGSQPGPQQT